MSTEADETRKAIGAVNPVSRTPPENQERTPPTVKTDDIEALLSRLDEIQDEDLERMDDEALEEALTRLGYDSTAFDRQANALREQLLELSTRTSSEAQRRRAVAARAWITGVRSVAVRCVNDRRAEESILRAHLRRLGASTGLAGRLGLSIVELSIDVPREAGLSARRSSDPTGPDLLLICAPDARDSRAESSPSARTVIFQPVSSGTDETLAGHRHDSLEPETTVLRYRGRAELRDLCGRALAEWLLDVRLDLIFTREMRPPHGVPSAGTTLCVSLGGGRAFGSTREALSEGSGRLWNRIGALIGEYGGTLGASFVDTAFFHFVGADRHDRAVKAGDLLIRRLSRIEAPERGGSVLPRFDLFRAVVDDLPASEPAETIRQSRLPRGLGFLSAMAVRAGRRAVGVTGDVYARLSHGLRGEFEQREPFCGAAIFERTRRASWPVPLTEEEADDVTEITDGIELLMDGDGDLSTHISEAVEGLYRRLGRKLGQARLHLVVERHRRGRIRSSSIRLALRMLDDERRAWGRFEERLAGRRADPRDGDPWTELFGRLSDLREEVRGMLRRAASESPRAGWRPRRPPLPWPCGRGIRTLGDVLDRDEIEIASGLTRLITQNREEILVYLRHPFSPEDLSRPSRERMWRLAELIVAEDFHEGYDPGRSFLGALAHGPLSEARIEALYGFVHAEHDRDPWSAEDELRARGAVVSPANARKLWLGRLLSSSDPDRRAQALRHLPVRSLWPLLVYPRTPVGVLVSMVARVRDCADELTAWIVTGSVLHRWSGRSPSEVDDEEPRRKALARMLDALDGLAQPIERVLVTRLRRALERWEPPGSEGWRERLDRWERRIEAGVGSERPRLEVLARLASLPAGVQWHLASHGYFLEYFCCHEDERIACATRPYIDAERVERVVAQEEINDRLLDDLLEAQGMFRRVEALEALVRNPKCDPELAISRLELVPKEALLELIADPRVHPAVRGKAEDLLRVRHFSPG